MGIPKIDLWKISKVSFSDSRKGTLLTLDSIEPVLTAIEQSDLPLQEESAEPDDPAEWKEWSTLYDSLYDTLRDIRDLLRACETHCRQNKEMWATYKKLLERYNRLHDRYGEQSW